MLPVSMILLCVIVRAVPHPANFAPVGAVAIFAGRTLKPWVAIALVAVAMGAGDFLLAMRHGFSVFNAVTPFVYFGFIVQAMLGRIFRPNKAGAILAAISGSLAFYLVSNFGVWAYSGIYPHSVFGIYNCYVAGLPFLGGTLAGDLVWTLILSSGYRIFANWIGPNPFWMPIPSQKMGVL